MDPAEESQCRTVPDVAQVSKPAIVEPNIRAPVQQSFASNKLASERFDKVARHSGFEKDNVVSRQEFVRASSVPQAVCLLWGPSSVPK